MSRIFHAVILAAIIFGSCTGTPGTQVFRPTETREVIVIDEPFEITDFMNQADGGSIPLWVSAFLDGGIRETENLEQYRESYIFISRNEGTNFNALRLWADGFSTELDFPRLAAARIESRFITGVPFPDNEYGAFYEVLVRAASDAQWAGAQREDNFWIRKRYLPTEDNPEQERETWEFFILITMDKELFAHRTEEIFRNINPSPQPTRAQNTAINRIKERFFDDF